MFDTFRRNFPRDATGPAENELWANAPAVAGLREVFGAFGGASFRGGLYRIIRPADLNEWSDLASIRKDASDAHALSEVAGIDLSFPLIEVSKRLKIQYPLRIHPNWSEP